MRKIASLLIVLFLFACSSVFASVESDLDAFFDRLGFATDTQDQKAYQAQQAGFYSGGRLFGCNSGRGVQLVHMDLPSFKSGCGNIDLFYGGVSFIKADQLVAMMKNILNSAGSYAFNLALETVTPEIANTLKYIQELANKVNQTNINTCETASALVGSIWPRTNVAEHHVCADVGTSGTINMFSDYAEARQGCGAGNRMSETIAKAKSSSSYKKMVIDNTNLAWQAIMQNDLAKGDYEFAELLMSLSGSIIVRKNGSGDDAANTFTLLPSLATDESLIKTLLYGGSAKIYKCDEMQNCTQPYIADISINSNHALESRVIAILNTMADKIIADKHLEPIEIGLLQASHFPLYKLLHAQLAFTKNRSILDLSQYGVVIASDLLFHYLNSNLALVKQGIGHLQFPLDITKQFTDGLEKAITAMRSTQSLAYNQLQLSLQAVISAQSIDQALNKQLSTEFANALAWAQARR